MRIDPASLVTHTAFSLPVRIAFAWGTGLLGAYLSALIGGQNGSPDSFVFFLLLYPFILIIFSLLAGWWSIIAIPAVIAFAWSFLSYVRDMGNASDLLRIFTFSMIVYLPLSLERWPVAAIVVVIAFYLFLKIDRRNRSSV